MGVDIRRRGRHVNPLHRTKPQSANDYTEISMPDRRLLHAPSSMLLIVDVQERLLPAMHKPKRLTANIARLQEAAALLGVPVVASEQYPKGLGPTVPEIAVGVPGGNTLDKMAFSCTGDERLVDKLGSLGRSQLVIAGIEAHVCVLQTAIGFAETDYDVYVVQDAVSSRRKGDVALATNRMTNYGVSVINVEMALFEWMERAGTDDFKAISKLIR
jgi:nicotinamidase-related amidase